MRSVAGGVSAVTVAAELGQHVSSSWPSVSPKLKQGWVDDEYVGQRTTECAAGTGRKWRWQLPARTVLTGRTGTAVADVSAGDGRLDTT